MQLHFSRMSMNIREASVSDLEAVLAVERAAFGGEEEAELTRALLEDPSARPCLSLLAMEDERAVGHVLFTAARVVSQQISQQKEKQETVLAVLLAPLAVVPEYQRQGVGSGLVAEGFRRLAAMGVELVFVLGSPEYYSRFGFVPAGALGFEAPYVLPEKWAEAWRVRSLSSNLLDSNIIGNVSGKVICADAISKPEFWQE